MSVNEAPDFVYASSADPAIAVPRRRHDDCFDRELAYAFLFHDGITITDSWLVTSPWVVNYMWSIGHQSDILERLCHLGLVKVGVREHRPVKERGLRTMLEDLVDQQGQNREHIDAKGNDQYFEALSPLVRYTKRGRNCLEWHGDVGAAFHTRVSDALSPDEAPLSWLSTMPSEWRAVGVRSARRAWDRSADLRNYILETAPQSSGQKMTKATRKRLERTHPVGLRRAAVWSASAQFYGIDPEGVNEPIDLLRRLDRKSERDAFGQVARWVNLLYQSNQSAATVRREHLAGDTPLDRMIWSPPTLSPRRKRSDRRTYVDIHFSLPRASWLVRNPAGVAALARARDELLPTLQIARRNFAEEGASSRDELRRAYRDVSRFLCAQAAGSEVLPSVAREGIPAAAAATAAFGGYALQAHGSPYAGYFVVGAGFGSLVQFGLSAARVRSRLTRVEVRVPVLNGEVGEP